MHFIDQIDFVASLVGGILHIVKQVAGIFDFGSRCGIDFDQIHEAALVKILTDFALSARIEILQIFAIDCFSQNTGNCGFAYAARARKQISVMQSIMLQCMDK